MADTKISDLTALTAPAVDDELVIVDKSDTTMGASGTDKRITPPNLGVPIVVRKSADETVNNSTTLQNDDHLLFTGAANTSYLVELTLLLSAANTTADWKFDFSLPSGGTMHWGAVGTGGSPTVPWGSPATGTSSAVMLIETGSGAFGSAALIHGMILRGLAAITTAGTVQFRWAQNTLSATDSKVLANSVLIATKIG